MENIQIETVLAQVIDRAQTLFKEWLEKERVYYSSTYEELGRTYHPLKSHNVSKDYMEQLTVDKSLLEWFENETIPSDSHRDDHTLAIDIIEEYARETLSDLIYEDYDAEDYIEIEHDFLYKVSDKLSKLMCQSLF